MLTENATQEFLTHGRFEQSRCFQLSRDMSMARRRCEGSYFEENERAVKTFFETVKTHQSVESIKMKQIVPIKQFTFVQEIMHMLITVEIIVLV